MVVLNVNTKIRNIGADGLVKIIRNPIKTVFAGPGNMRNKEEFQALDTRLYEWANYHSKEFNAIYWPCASMSYKLIEICRTGLYSPGTKPQEEFRDMPSHIQIIQEAINDLPQVERCVITIQYEKSEKQSKKAKKLSMNLNTYRSHLLRARQKLLNSI